MATLKREELLAAPLPHEVVPVPERKGEVYVWTLTADRGEALSSEDGAVTAGMIAAASIGDEDGPYNPPLTVGEAKRLFGLRTFSRVVDAAMRINVMTEEAAKELQGN